MKTFLSFAGLAVASFFASLANAAVPALPSAKTEMALPEASAAKSNVVQPPLSPRFKQTRERIDALFRNRNETPPPPDPKMNPFRPTGAVVVVAPPSKQDAHETAVREPSSSDLARLQQAVATLKVSGTVEKDGKLYLAINGRQYKDNEIIQTQVQGEPVYLRIKQISRKGLTVSLNDAEIALKF